MENNYVSLYWDQEHLTIQYQLVLEKVNHHKTRCVDIVNLQRGANTYEEVYGNRETNIYRDLTKTSLNKTNMEFITLTQTRELIDIDNVGTVIMGGFS